MFLDRILASKREEVARRKKIRPISDLLQGLEPSSRSLAQALTNRRTGFILEMKKASPSQGLIRVDFDPRAIARSYASFADAISVLCDEPFFQGRLEYVRTVSETVSVPVLCKDFVVDPYQVAEARSFGADAILLMASVLDDASLAACLKECTAWKMDALVEVHDRHELDRVLRLPVNIIGINNRNLKDLTVDLLTTSELAPLIPDDKLVVCESGIRDHQDVRKLRHLADGFLVGTAVMKQANLDQAVRNLLFGRTKICGMTRPEDAAHALAAGAGFLGMIFWSRSPRFVELAAARDLCASLPEWVERVGVFVNPCVAMMLEYVETLGLSVVQLHGNEEPGFIEEIRTLLPSRCRIWKAWRVKDDSMPSRERFHSDKILLDTFDEKQQGGTGKTFDWDLVRKSVNLQDLIVAGGISPDNVEEADRLEAWALDVNSGVESAPGEKDPRKVEQLFALLRGTSRRGR
jgi:indole-3-glycerol phosphate synthase/phosphoribosylanthranilate isomerase